MSEHSSPGARGPTASGPPARAPSGEGRAGRLWLRLFIKLALAALLLTLAFTLVLGVHIQRGNGMYPFLMDGDVVVLCRPGPYRVGDVVAFRRPDTGQTALSRIAAGGGSTVMITDTGRLFVDDAAPAERVFYPTYPALNTSVSFPYTVDADSFFLLDDFREEGQDSRVFGQVSAKDILGKAVYVFRRRGI